MEFIAFTGFAFFIIGMCVAFWWWAFLSNIHFIGTLTGGFMVETD